MCVFDIDKDCFIMTKKNCKNCFARCETITEAMERYAAILEKSEDQDTKSRCINELTKILKANEGA